MKGYYESFRKSKWFPLAIGIMSIVIGLICIANPQINMESIALYFGIVILGYGVFQILAGLSVKDNQNLKIVYIVIGAIITILAICVFLNLALIGKYLPTLIGFFMIVASVMALLRSLVLFKNGLKSWWAGAVPALIVLALGLVFLLAPGFVGQTFGIFTGVTLLLNGVSGLINFIQYKK